MHLLSSIMLPNAYRTEHPCLTQANLQHIYKMRIEEYIFQDKSKLLEKYKLKGPAENTDEYIKLLMQYIWSGYCYMMGQKNFWWQTAPPPPMVTPEWLQEFLKPILSKWINEQLALSSSG